MHILLKEYFWGIYIVNVEFYIIQVNSNGILSFEVVFIEFSPTLFPIRSGTPLIAPYWDNVDIRDGGTIFYRQTTNVTLLQRASDEIQDGLSLPFSPSHLLIATWDAVNHFQGGSDGVIIFNAVCIYIDSLQSWNEAE